MHCRPSRTISIAGILLTVFVCGGCGSNVQVSPGGTPGSLHDGDKPIGEVKVTVYEVDGTTFEPIGFAVARSDGRFELVTMDVTGPLRLPPGEYCCTLESVGEPVVIPKEYSKPETTPLKAEWSEGDSLLDLEFQPPQKQTLIR